MSDCKVDRKFQEKGKHRFLIRKNMLYTELEVVQYYKAKKLRVARDGTGDIGREQVMESFVYHTMEFGPYLSGIGNY